MLHEPKIYYVIPYENASEEGNYQEITENCYFIVICIVGEKQWVVCYQKYALAYHISNMLLFDRQTNLVADLINLGEESNLMVPQISRGKCPGPSSLVRVNLQD